MEFHPFILAVFFLYFASLIAIAVVRVRPMREMSDYVLGGRRMSSFTSALSASSSTTSGWTMLVFPALAFSEGAVQLWTALSIVLGVWLVWTILGKRLRRYTILEDSLTLPEFFEKRFADRTGILRTLTAVLTLFFIMIYIDSGLIAGAKLLETVFGVAWTPGVLVTLVAVTSYTFIGGFLAVSRTDVFQAMLMLAGFFGPAPGAHRDDERPVPGPAPGPGLLESPDDRWRPGRNLRLHPLDSWMGAGRFRLAAHLATPDGGRGGGEDRSRAATSARRGSSSYSDWVSCWDWWPGRPLPRPV